MIECVCHVSEIFRKLGQLSADPSSFAVGSPAAAKRSWRSKRKAKFSEQLLQLTEAGTRFASKLTFKPYLNGSRTLGERVLLDVDELLTKQLKSSGFSYIWMRLPFEHLPSGTAEPCGVRS